MTNQNLNSLLKGKNLRPKQNVTMIDDESKSKLSTKR